MNEKGFTAFISYRHQFPDQDVAKQLHTAIETYRIPAKIRKRTGREKMGRVFRDEEELPLSADLGKDIEDALDRSEWLISVCSPQYLKSRWCMRELEYFIEKHGKDHVLTILTEGEPQDSFPKVLQFREDENGVPQPVEPLAADVRSVSIAESLKKLKQEKLRLLAPILGVSYDDLRERERQRRKKRILSMTAILVVLAGVLTGILIHNANLRRAAEEQRLAAEEQQRIAEEERKRAEEEKQRAEGERLNALSNSIGEALQKASAARIDSDKRKAAGILLDALTLSETNGNMRREEIMDELRRTMYIEPYTVVSRMKLGNGRLNNSAISPDGKKAICIVNSNIVALFDLESSNVLHTVSKGNGETTYIAFSPDGSRFITLSDNYHYATVWNAEDGSEIYTYTSKTDEQRMVGNAVFFGNSDTLLIQDHDKFYRISLPDGKEELFYTIGEQQDGYLYDTNLYTFMGGKQIDEMITDYTESYIFCPMVVSRDGTKVLIAGLAGKTGTIILNENGERISLLDRAPGVTIDYYGMSPDGKYAACQYRGFGYVCVWETDTGRLKHMKKLDREMTNGASKPVFSPDSQKVAFLSEKSLYILDAEKGKELVRTEVEWEDPVPMILNWSEDGNYLTFFTPDLYIVDAETGKVLLFKDGNDSLLYNNVIPVGSDYVFATQGGGEADLFSLPGIASIQVKEDYQGEVTGYDPRSLAADVPWAEEPKSGHQISENFKFLNKRDDYEPYIYYSEKGEYAALLYPDGAIEVFRSGEGEKAFLENTQLYDEPTAFGIFGNRMASADKYGRIMFQGLDDNSLIVLSTDHLYSVFMAEGNYLAAARKNCSGADIYDLQKGELLFSLESPSPLTRIGFSEDGNYVLGQTEESGTIYGNLWQNESALLEAARRFAPGH